jgi:uncharacterized membrane protein
VIAGPIMLGSSVDFAVPVEVAFDYLADPRNRPEWQSSLRSVELLDTGVPRSGLRWVDVTALGLRPRLEITALERPEVWVEAGVWRGIRARLALWFEPQPEGCTVTVTVRVKGRGLWRPVGPLVTVAAALAVPRDLRRAARILSERSDGH